MRFLPAGLFALSLIAFGTPSRAGNLVTNGDFEQSTNGPGQLGYNTASTGWTVSSGYAFLFAPGTADTTGDTGQYGNLKLWGPGDGSANGLTASSPSGGNFLALDGAFQIAPLQQTINNLVVGSVYQLTFNWAGAQQYTFNGATTEAFQVSLGGQTRTTATLNNPTHGFTGWQGQTFFFNATSTSEVLSFLAIGTPDGQPPFSLLDSIDLEQTVPEPASFALLAVGMGILMIRARKRRPDPTVTEAV